MATEDPQGPSIRSDFVTPNVETAKTSVRHTPPVQTAQASAVSFEASRTRELKEDRVRVATKLVFNVAGFPEDAVKDPNLGGFEVGDYHPLGANDPFYRYMTVTNRSWTHWIENDGGEAWTKFEVNYERSTSARTYEIHESTANIGVADWYTRGYGNRPLALLHDGRSAVVVPTPMPVIRIHYPLVKLTEVVRRIGLRRNVGFLNAAAFLGEPERFWKLEAVQITPLYGNALATVWADLNIILRGDPLRGHAVFTPLIDTTGDGQVPRADVDGLSYGKPGDAGPFAHRITHILGTTSFDHFLALGDLPTPPPSP